LRHFAASTVATSAATARAPFIDKPTPLTVEPVPTDEAAWLEDGCAALVARASATSASKAAGAKSGGGQREKARRAQAEAEARARSAALSTSADVTGVKFNGCPSHQPWPRRLLHSQARHALRCDRRDFQRLYLQSKFCKRASLLYQLLGSVLQSPPSAAAALAARAVLEVEVTAKGSGKRKLCVCSVGGGPGTDAAGIVAANARWLGFGRGGGGAHQQTPREAGGGAGDAASGRAAVGAARAAVAAAGKAAATARERRDAHEKRARATAARASAAAAAASTVGDAASAKAEADAQHAATAAKAAAEAAASAEAAHATATAELSSVLGEAGGGGGTTAPKPPATDVPASDDGDDAPLHISLLDNEPQWKSYTATLQRHFAPRGATVDFGLCDVAHADGLEGCSEAVAGRLRSADLFVFAFVCHETSTAAAAAGWAIYRQLARQCKSGAVLIFADVVGRSAGCFEQVHAAMERGLAEGEAGDEGEEREAEGEGRPLQRGGGRVVRRVPLPEELGRGLHADLMLLHVARTEAASGEL